MNVGTKATHNPGRRPTTTPFTQPPARSPNEPHNYLGRFWPTLRFIGMLCYFLTAFIFITFLLCFFYCFFLLFRQFVLLHFRFARLKCVTTASRNFPFGSAYAVACHKLFCCSIFLFFVVIFFLYIIFAFFVIIVLYEIVSRMLLLLPAHFICINRPIFQFSATDIIKCHIVTAAPLPAAGNVKKPHLTVWRSRMRSVTTRRHSHVYAGRVNAGDMLLYGGVAVFVIVAFAVST